MRPLIIKVAFTHSLNWRLGLCCIVLLLKRLVFKTKNCPLGYFQCAERVAGQLGRPYVVAEAGREHISIVVVAPNSIFGSSIIIREQRDAKWNRH